MSAQKPNDDDTQRTVTNTDNAKDTTATSGADIDADLDALEFDAADEDIIDADETDYEDDEDDTWEDDPEDDPDQDTPDDEDTGEDDTTDSNKDDEEDYFDEDELDWEAPDELDDETLDDEGPTLENDPAVLREMLAKSRRENAARRKKFNEFRDESVTAIEQGVASFLEQVADQIGLNVEDPSDADAVITAVNELVTGSKDQRARAERDLAIYRAASSAGADMAKLADSKSFTAQVDTLDATAETFGADVATAVKSALEREPHFKVAAEIPRSGGDFTSGIPANNPDDDSVEALRQKRQKRAGR